MKSMRSAARDKLVDVTFAEDSDDFKGPKPPEYPHGLRICLSEESIKLLGLKDLPSVGDKMKMMATVEVVSVGSYKSEDGLQRNVDLQITDMDLIGKGKVDVDKMYEVAQPVKEVSES